MNLSRARSSGLPLVAAFVRAVRASIAALLVAATVGGPNPARADEGEWPPDRLATLGDAFWTAWRQRGLALGATDLWDGRGGGLATAAVALRGCSAAFVSPDGLLLTNHHCAFEALALASTPGRDYLKDGFVSHGRAGEVEARGGASRVWVLARTEDVTGRVRGPGSAFARAGGDRERFRAVERARKELVAECEARPDRRCLVVPFLDGLSWVREEQVELRDVRLVYAPPRDVGDFGGEVDNFRWPRHAGDFAVLRAYVAPDGSPAPFSAANVPYRPKAWLPVSTSGVKEGDALAILGYPGKTQRFLTAAAVDDLEGWFYPLRARTLGDLIGILERETEGDPAASLKVASAVKGFNNSRTNALGQIEGLKRNGVAARARREEERLSAWLASRPDAPPSWRSAPRDVEAVLARDRQGRDRQ